MVDAIDQIEATAGQRELSLDAWMVLVGLNVDQPSIPHHPEDMEREEAILRLALIRESINSTTQQRKFRKRVAQGKGKGELNALRDAWLEYRSAFNQD